MSNGTFDEIRLCLKDTRYRRTEGKTRTKGKVSPCDTSLQLHRKRLQSFVESYGKGTPVSMNNSYYSYRTLPTRIVIVKVYTLALSVSLWITYCIATVYH